MNLKAIVVPMGCLLLMACTNHGKVRELELGRLAEWLPGEYRSADSHLLILPIAAPFIGDRVLYVERTDASHQVFAQNLYRFEKSADEKLVVQRTFTFKEPQRWLRGYQRPEIFKSLVREDVSATPACDLVWTFQQEALTAKTSMKACRLQQLEFNGEELKFVERGSEAGSMVIFQRMVLD